VAKEKKTPCVWQLPDGRWQWRKRVRGPFGHKRPKGIARTKAEALRAMHRAVEALLNPTPKPSPPKKLPTVAEYAEAWLDRRRQLGLATVASDATRIRLHALPHIGRLPIDAVKPRHLRDLVYALRADRKLAPRTILKTTATLHSLFKSAYVEELVAGNPVAFEPGVLPKKADRDPDWRHQAVYTRDEVAALLSDDRIPADRRILYGLKCLAALRHAEAANLTWRQLDTATTPLWRINLGKTKSGVPRHVPVHPTLAKMLATWKLTGWSNTFGRHPQPEDLIVPALTMKPRAPKEAQDALVGDLALLKFRIKAGTRMNRRGHDLRRTFVSLAQADGSRRDVIEWGTHGPRGDIMSMYTSMPWPTLCDEWSKLRIELNEGALISLRHDRPSALTIRARKRWLDRGSKSAGPQTGPGDSATGCAQSQPHVVATEMLVTPKGLEPLFSA
jgi:integrase